jgi:hypothetical protein
MLTIKILFKWFIKNNSYKKAIKHLFKILWVRNLLLILRDIYKIKPTRNVLLSINN